MLIQEPRPQPGDVTREVRVKLPMDLILRMHGIKMIRGIPLGDQMTAAVVAYLRKEHGVNVEGARDGR